MSIETNPFAKLVVRIVVYSLLGWFFLGFNPFGISDKADQATQNALYKLAAPYYLSDAQQDIIIVLVNQSSINELYARQAIEANEWPIRYRDHAYLLSRILKYSPKSVFVDIYFKQERTTDDSFDQFMRLAGRMSKKYKSPLLFAGGYQDELYTDTQLKLGEVGELVITGWQGYGQAYPLNNNGRLTAAYRLYQLTCPKDSPFPSCKTPLIDTAATEVGDAVSVLWGNRPGQVVFPEFSRSVCADRSGSLIEVGRQLLFGFIDGLVNYDELTAPVDAQCAYHTVIYADELVYIDKSGSKAEKLRLAAALENKVVMYGLSLEGLHDNIYSPAHGQLPGVFFHAMALDNLMYYGADFVHASDDRIALINMGVWILMTVFFSFVLFYYDCKEFPFSSQSDQWIKYVCPASRISALQLFWIAALIIIIISIAMFLLLRYEPLNSIGFLVLIGVSSWLVHSDFAERILKALAFSWLFGDEKEKAKAKDDEAPDHKKVEAFYKDIFKLELVMEHGWIRNYSKNSEMTAEVSTAVESGSCAPVPDLSIEVDNVKAALDRVKRAKIAIEYGPETESCGIRRFYFRDPFGKLVNVFQYKKKAKRKQGKSPER